MVYKWDVTIPQLSGDETRTGYVYLPDSYNADPSRRFPVMYMFDGHNVFFDTDATYGKSWGLNSYMSWTKKPLIIVAIECSHTQRMAEYSPMKIDHKDLGKINGRGRIYMDWLVHTLKPEIDARLRTLSDREHTIICGSSMGGLMALYAACQYNDYFQRAVCLSPSVWVAPRKVGSMIANSSIRDDTCIYMDYGSEEMNNHEANRDALLSTVRLLMGKNVSLTFRIIPGGSHCEASWEKQIPIFMDCLGI